MKRLLFFLISLGMALAMQSQALHFETFDNGIPADWTLLNDNNTAHQQDYADAWTVRADIGFPAPSVVSTSWFNRQNYADRWLVSSPVYVPDSGYHFMMSAACVDPAYRDGFEVRISTTGGDAKDSFPASSVIKVNYCDTVFHEHHTSLDAYVGDTIWIAVIQNSWDMNLLIVDNLRIAKPEEPELSIVKFNCPSSITYGDTKILGGTIANLSTTPLTDFNYTITINSRVSSQRHIGGLDLGLGETYTFLDTVPLLLGEGFWDITIQVSHTSLADSLLDYSLNNGMRRIVLVSQDGESVYNRASLVEQFADINSAESAELTAVVRGATLQDEHSIWINYHPDDVFSNSAALEMASWFPYTVTSGVMVDRINFNNSSADPLFTTNTISEMASTISTMRAIPCHIRMGFANTQYQEGLRLVSTNLMGRWDFADSIAMPRLRVYLVEDSVYLKGHNDFTPDSRMPKVVREMVYDGALTRNTDSTFALPLGVVIPEDFLAWRCHLVAVAYHDGDNINYQQVMNSATTAVPAAYFDVDNIPDISLYPNPTSSKVVFTSNKEIKSLGIYDLQGRCVYSHLRRGEISIILDVSQWHKGTYVARIRTDQGLVLKRFSVIR